MNTSNKNYQITRRETIRSLARLPLITLGLTIPGTIVQASRYGDALAHCSAALEGCWQLWESDHPGDNSLALHYISQHYLPLLKTIAKDSALYRKEALHLATQYALLKVKLGYICVSMTETIAYAKEALALSQETGEVSLQLSASIKLASAYVDEKQYAPAFQTMQEGEAVLKRYQQTQNPQLPSSVRGYFYSAMALTQTKNGICSDLALGIATESAPGLDLHSFIDFEPATQLREIAAVYCSQGDQMQAMKYLGKRIDPETLAPLLLQTEGGRIGTINLLTLSMLKSKERDMEKIIHHWSAAIEGAKALRYEYAFNQAAANFEAMEYTFPGEKRITELRDHLVHW